MFENKTEQQAKEEILKNVKAKAAAAEPGE